MKQLTTLCGMTAALLSFFHVLPVSARTEREVWLEQCGALNAQVKNSPGKETVQALVREFASMGRHMADADQDFLNLYEDIRKTLVTIPTLPDQLRDLILKERAAQEVEPTQEMRDNAYSLTMEKVVPYFGVLARLKTPASVRVLGELLSDHRGAADPNANFGIEGRKTVYRVRTSNSQYAMESLMASSLENKPLVIPPNFKYRRPTREQIAVWERWYGRIKAGQTTFRFEGDPTEYDLDGPASPEKLARLRANRERDEALEKRRSTAANRTGGPISNDHPPRSGAFAHLPWPGLLASSAAVLAALGWYFLRRGKPHAG